MEKSVRAYIAQHKSEFYEAGEEPEADGGEAATANGGPEHARDASSSSVGTAKGIETQTKKPSEPLAFISDTVPAARPICEFVTTIWDTLADLTRQMSTLVLCFLAISVLLLILNTYQFSALRKSSSRYKPTRLPPDYSGRYGYVSEQTEVAAAVRGVLQDYFDVQKPEGAHSRSVAIEQLSPKEEVQEIRKMLESLEMRVGKLKASLSDLD